VVKEAVRQLTFEQAKASLLALVNQVKRPDGETVKQ
jgi:hypothetical protein